jgi:flagellar motor switch protein FliN/FliY
MPSQSSAIDFLCNQFCEAFGAVFEQIAGESYMLSVSEHPRAADPGALSYGLECSGKVRGTMFVQVDSDSAAVLATRFMGDAVDGSVSFRPEHADALSEIVSQTAGCMATELRTRFGAGDVHVERKSASSSGSPNVITLKSATEGDAVSVCLIADQALLDSVSACLAGKSSPIESSFHDSPGQVAPDNGGESQNLRLIMDVELDLTLRFGQRTLALSEVADLTTGSVVELDRVVDEPVELLLGERVIARGDVVIVDGNYGLRIIELTSVDRSHFFTA